MKFLIRSGCGESLAIALKLRDEGNQVRFAISEEGNKEYSNVGNGIIEKTTLARSIDWADVIIFDSNIFDLPAEAEAVRKYKPALGSSRFSGELENDRALAVQIAKSVGLKVPDYEEFVGNKAWDMARRFLEGQSEKAWVWKPNGESPASTFVSSDVDQMIHMFSYWEELFEEHGDEPNFILTTKIEGEEISTEGWFNGEEFFLPNHTLERTRFFDGDHGEKTGCAGNVVWSQQTSLFETLIKPFAKTLSGKYRGPLDVNCIIEKESNAPVFLEFTPRFGYDAIFGLAQVLNSDLGELFYQIASQKRVTASVKSSFAGMVRVHIPPYPEHPAKDDKLRPVGIPIAGIPKDFKIGPCYPIEVMIKEDSLVTSGPDGYVVVVGADGGSPKESMNNAYKEVEKIDIPLMRYRLDLADKLQEVFETIRKTGWIGSKAFGGRR